MRVASPLFYHENAASQLKSEIFFQWKSMCIQAMQREIRLDTGNPAGSRSGVDFIGRIRYDKANIL